MKEEAMRDELTLDFDPALLAAVDPCPLTWD